MKKYNLKITPMEIDEFVNHYGLKYDDNLPNEYYDYLQSNLDLHHYSPFQNSKDWFAEQMSSVNWTNSVNDLKTTQEEKTMKNNNTVNAAIAVHKIDAFEARRMIEDVFDSDTELTTYDQVYYWLEHSYSTFEIINYLLDNGNNYENLLFCIQEIGIEAKATMHSDDPSLLQFFSELYSLETVIKKAYQLIK